jgi:ABC-type sugar transport system permease subunit
MITEVVQKRRASDRLRDRFTIRLSLARREAIAFYVFLTPWAIGYLLWTFGPMVASLILSFTRYDVITPPTFIGLKNYVEIVTTQAVPPRVQGMKGVPVRAL